jgi:hypothetical protein
MILPVEYRTCPPETGSTFASARPAVASQLHPAACPIREVVVYDYSRRSSLPWQLHLKRQPYLGIEHRLRCGG